MQEAFQKWSLSGEFLDGGLDLGIRIQRQQVLSTFIQAWWTPACYCHPHFVLFCFLDEELHSLTYICVLSHHQSDLACQSDGASSRLKTPPMVPADSLLIQLSAPTPSSLGSLLSWSFCSCGFSPHSSLSLANPVGLLDFYLEGHLSRRSSSLTQPMQTPWAQAIVIIVLY